VDRESAARELARHYEVGEEVAARVLRWFGSRAPKVLEPGRMHPRLVESLAPGIPESMAELRYLARYEFAMTLVDALRRRLPRLLLDRVPRADLVAAAAALGDELGWNRARQEAEVAAALAEQALPWASTDAEAPSIEPSKR
jgi:glycerol-3-phosphate dehydrogenase